LVHPLQKRSSHIPSLSARFCTECGTQLPAATRHARCIHCGNARSHSLSLSARFCSECGTQLPSATQYTHCDDCRRDPSQILPQNPSAYTSSSSAWEPLT
jgi:DNA-directed RNA polymerase subunit RPC12/RpoP